MENENFAPLQCSFLRDLLRSRTPVTVFLANGFRMDGVVTGYDNSVIIFDTNGQQQMIYTHFISTVVPSVPMPLGK